MAPAIRDVAVFVEGLGRSGGFYTDGLGLEVVARIDTPEVREVIVSAPNEGSQLMLARRRNSEPVAPSGIWKVFVYVDDVTSTYQRVIDHGGAAVDPPRHYERWQLVLALA